VEQGDLHGALPWFAEALRLDRGDPAREENHRLRLAATLQRSPKLVALWATEAGPGRALFCPDGRGVAVMDTGRLQIWDAVGGRLRLVITKDAALSDFAFSPDGKQVATASRDRTARVWDVATGQPVTAPLRHDGPVNQVAFSPDVGRLVTASDDRTARLWDAATGKQLRGLTPHNDPVQSASFSPDGKRVVTRSQGMIRVWRATDGKLVMGFHADVASLQDAVFNADGSHILVTGGQRILRTADAHTGQLLPQISQQGSAWLSPDRRRLVSGTGREGHDLPAQVWDVREGKPITPPLPQTRRTVDGVFSLQGDRLATIGADGSVRVWQVETAEVVAGPLRHAAAVTSAAFSPDGRLLVTRDSAGLTRVWDLAGGIAPASLLQPFKSVNRWFSPDGRWVLSVTPYANYWLWDARTGRLVKVIQAGRLGAGPAAVYSDGSRLVTAARYGAAQVWQAATGLPVGEELRHESWVMHVEFSPDGRLVATTSADRTACVWDAGTGKRLAEMKHEHAVRRAAFSPDGRRLATASGELRSRRAIDIEDMLLPRSDPGRAGEAQVWEVPTGRPITQPMPHEGVVVRASFSPDGRFLLTTCVGRAADRYQVQVWDAATGRSLTPPLVHPQRVWHETFSPDGRLVATACTDGAARIWDAVTGEPLRVLPRHSGPVRHVAFSPDARRLLTASDDGTARLWDAATGQPITVLRHRQAVLHAVFAPDGYSVITGCVDLTVRVWPLAPDRRPVDDWGALARVMTGGGGDAVGSAGFSTLAGEHGLKPARPTPEEDWNSTWQTLRAKYPENFATTKAEQQAWHRAALETATSKKDWSAALAHLSWLLDIDPADWPSRLARARLLARLERRDEAKTEFTRAIELHPDVPEVWVARGSFWLGRGQRDRAEGDFARAIDRRASPNLPAVLSGFWVAGLYPQDFNASFPPETQTDPARAIPVQPGTRGNLPVLARWRPEAMDTIGYLDLAACFDQAEHISAYALAFIYSKTDQEVLLLSGSDDELRLWLNGRLVHQVPEGRAPAPDQDRTLARLRAGWNVVLAKVLNDTGQHGLFLRIAADPVPEARGKPEEAALLLRRGALRARTCQWQLAAEDYTRALQLDPNAADGWYELAAVRLQLRDLDGYRRDCREMLRRFGRTTEPYQAERTAKASLIAPSTTAEKEQLVRLIEQALKGTEKEWGHPWFLLSRGIAEYRAGRPRQAIDWIQKGRGRLPDAPPVYLVLGQLFASLAYHQLHEADKARAALSEASKIMDQQFPNEESGDLGDSWLDWVFCQAVRREAQTLIDSPSRGLKKQDPDKRP
jgi:WD40 repeat protein/tetratricopeptide (TPR) repeat protein